MIDINIPLYFVLVVLLAHWISDFVLQTDQMARGKSSSFKWLSLHVATYTGAMFLLVLLLCQCILDPTERCAASDHRFRDQQAQHLSLGEEAST
jgi:hypothetical protein